MDLTKTEPKARVKRRRRESGHLYVRVSGPRYQARVWLPFPVGAINLGLHDSPGEAWAAVKAWFAAGASPTKGLPRGILPKWVSKTDAGFFARCSSKSGCVSLGPFPSAAAAHVAMYEHVKPRPSRKRR